VTISPGTAGTDPAGPIDDAEADDATVPATVTSGDDDWVD
jgi:hypothetical protein